MPHDDVSTTLRGALVAAYRPHLERRLAGRSVDAAAGLLPDAIDEGQAWLEAELEDLLGLPYREQTRGPLEVFQEAMRFPTHALDAGGVPPARRDPVAEAALPGDRHDLAPASSQELGRAVWEAHLAWGAVKAMAFRPSVALLSADLMDRSRVEPVVQAAGCALDVWRSAGQAAGRPALLLVDLTHPEADAVIRSFAADGVKVIAFGPHVDDFAMVRARSLGAAEALPRSVFFRTLEGLLPAAV